MSALTDLNSYISARDAGELLSQEKKTAAEEHLRQKVSSLILDNDMLRSQIDRLERKLSDRGWEIQNLNEQLYNFSRGDGW